MREVDEPIFIAELSKGIPLDELHQRLRPEGSSGVGFMGRDENLLEVIHDDWLVVNEHGTTHKEIAQALRDLNLHPDYELGHAFGEVTAGNQECPWDCEVTGQNTGVIIKKGITEDEKYFALGRFGEVLDLDETLELMEGTLSEPRIRRMIAIKDELQQGRGEFFIVVTGLLPHLIEDHHFFEGRQSPYRADPEFLIQALGLTRK